MTRMIRGLAVPRIIRSHNACLTCRRSGIRCHWGSPTCLTCDHNGLECIQPISAVCDKDDASDTLRDPNSAIKTKSSKDNRIVEYGWDLAPIPEKRDESIPLPKKTASHKCHRQPAPVPAPASGPASASVSSSEPSSESSSASSSAPTSVPTSVPTSLPTSVPTPDYLTRIKKHIYRSQQRRLEQTPRYVKRSVPSGSDDVDKDHDYAAYYDYHYDLDDTDFDLEEDEGDADDEGEEDNADGGKNGNVTARNGATQQRGPRDDLRNLLTLYPEISEIFKVKCTWTGEGEPTLLSRLGDYFSYMKGNHLPSHASLPVTLLPACDYGASETLRYYSLRPSNYPIDNVPDINPTNPKLLQLSYSNPLVLQLIIAQRVNHREVSSAVLPTGESADRFLADAIGKFGPKIDNYLSGNDEEMLPLTLGSIIVSLVDTARLDRLTQARNHPTAAKAILNNLLTLPHDEICKNMPDFLLEYYMHTAAFACLATNAGTTPQVPFVSRPLMHAVETLVAKKYHGGLCGSWLSILVLIPRIFYLGMAIRRSRIVPAAAYAPNHFVDFGEIQAKLFRFNPTEHGGTHVIDHSIAMLFRSAALLYLWSLLDAPHSEKPEGTFGRVMNKALLDAEHLLPTIPQEATLNVALCWPLLVIGCCTTDQKTQDLIRNRLVAIVSQFGVGNALETLFILQHVWTLPRARRSPWGVWHYIQNIKGWACSCPKCIPSLF